jgi:hypothetical protein
MGHAADPPAWLSRIGPRTCDCCGVEERTTGCVRGGYPCPCDNASSWAPRFQGIGRFLGYGVRCQTCRRCPVHCACPDTHMETTPECTVLPVPISRDVA